MSLTYATKEESNARREREFLALSGAERVAEFLALSRRVLREYPSSVARDYGDNLVLTRRGERAEADGIREGGVG